MSQTTSALPAPESAALETLYEAMTRAQQAFGTVQSRIAEGGKLQRLAPGVWVVTREAASEPTP